MRRSDPVMTEDYDQQGELVAVEIFRARGGFRGSWQCPMLGLSGASFETSIDEALSAARRKAAVAIQVKKATQNDRNA